MLDYVQRVLQRVFWRGVMEELLWFISGSTNSKVSFFAPLSQGKRYLLETAYPECSFC